MATWVLFRFNLNYGIQKYQPLPNSTDKTYLVLPSPSDVSTKGELILAEVVFREHVVELVHGQVDYVLHRDRQSQRERLPLVPGIGPGTRLHSLTRQGNNSLNDSNSNHTVKYSPKKRSLKIAT